MTKHTQGGWHRNIPPASKYCTIYAGRNTHVAYVATSGLTADEIEANCDLIAAAPDLLKAAEAVLSAHNNRSHNQTVEAIVKLAQAIRKAKGESA